MRKESFENLIFAGYTESKRNREKTYLTNGSNLTEIKKEVVKSHDRHCNKGTWNIIFNAFKIRVRCCICFPS